jgi:hypothetical protein
MPIQLVDPGLWLLFSSPSTGAGNAFGSCPTVTLGVPAGTATGAAKAAEAGRLSTPAVFGPSTDAAPTDFLPTDGPLSGGVTTSIGVTLSAIVGTATGGSASPGNAVGIAITVTLSSQAGTATGAATAVGIPIAVRLSAIPGHATGAAVAAGTPAGVMLAAVPGTAAGGSAPVIPDDVWIVSRGKFRLEIQAKGEDPADRHRLISSLCAVAKNAINGQSLGNLTFPMLTLLRREGKPTIAPPYAIQFMDGEWELLIKGFGGFDPATEHAIYEDVRARLDATGSFSAVIGYEEEGPASSEWESMVRVEPGEVNDIDDSDQ